MSMTISIYNLFHIRIHLRGDMIMRNFGQSLNQQGLPRKYNILCRTEVSSERKVNVSKTCTEPTPGGVVE